MIAARKIALVRIVPRSKPPYSVGGDNRSPNDAPSGRVKM